MEVEEDSYTNQMNFPIKNLGIKNLVTKSWHTCLYEEVGNKKARGAPNRSREQIHKPDPFPEQYIWNENEGEDSA